MATYILLDEENSDNVFHVNYQTSRNQLNFSILARVGNETDTSLHRTFDKHS